MATIARAVGISRERVRQRLERNGRAGPNRNALPSLDKIRDAARQSCAIDETANALNITPRALQLALDQRGARREILSTLEANRRKRGFEQRLSAQLPYVQRLRELATRLGHTPTIDELEPEGIFHARLAQLFGTASAAMQAAGLIPNRPGVPPLPLPSDFGQDDRPTEDSEELEARASRLILSGSVTSMPEGNSSPTMVTTTTTAYKRDPAVVAWVRKNAAGYCEACGAQGYETDVGAFFLEVHHLIPLSEGGSDTPRNAVAVCETCHGKLHRWIHRQSLLAELRSRIPRLMAVAA